MKKKQLSLFVLVLFVLFGCSDGFDYYISDSIFIEDIDNPGLPIYSEKGYNSMGVYWGLSPLVTEPGHAPSKVVVKDDSCHIHLSGSIKGESLYTLVLSLPNYSPRDYSGLLSLDNRSFDLTDGDECTISLLAENNTLDLHILEGSFKINRAQNMYIDRKHEGVVLSGVFSFKCLVNEQAVTFSKGRFDMRFGEDNFYYLQ